MAADSRPSSAAATKSLNEGELERRYPIVIVLAIKRSIRYLSFYCGVDHNYSAFL